MKKHSMPEMKEGGVNVTPLIDIVMCLIIFFMLVTKIGVARGIDKDIKLPSSTYGTKISDMGNTLSLNVHYITGAADPQVTLMIGSEVKDIKIVNPITKKQELLEICKEFKSTHPGAAKVIIRGDKDLEYGQLEVVLITVATAGITDMAYEAKPGKPEDSQAAP